MYINISSVFVPSPILKNSFKVTEADESVILDAKITAVTLRSIDFAAFPYQRVTCEINEINNSQFQFIEEKSGSVVLKTHHFAIQAQNVKSLKMEITLISPDDSKVRAIVTIPVKFPKGLKLAADYRLEISPTLVASLIANQSE